MIENQASKHFFIYLFIYLANVLFLIVLMKWKLNDYLSPGLG